MSRVWEALSETAEDVETEEGRLWTQEEIDWFWVLFDADRTSDDLEDFLDGAEGPRR